MPAAKVAVVEAESGFTATAASRRIPTLDWLQFSTYQLRPAGASAKPTGMQRSSPTAWRPAAAGQQEAAITIPAKRSEPVVITTWPAGCSVRKHEALIDLCLNEQ